MSEKEALVIVCDCGKPALLGVVTWESRHQGEAFWACASQSCRMFEWAYDTDRLAGCGFVKRPGPK